jgi:hypothetical protein
VVNRVVGRRARPASRDGPDGEFFKHVVGRGACANPVHACSTILSLLFSRWPPNEAAPGGGDAGAGSEPVGSCARSWDPSGRGAGGCGRLRRLDLRRCRWRKNPSRLPRIAAPGRSRSNCPRRACGSPARWTRRPAQRQRAAASHPCGWSVGATDPGCSDCGSAV